MHTTKPTILLLVALAFMVALTGCAGSQKNAASQPIADPPGRYHLAYSFDPPADWAIESFPGMLIPVFVGPNVDGFRVNMNLFVCGSTESMDAFVETFWNGVESAHPNSELIGSEPVVATGGVSGIRLRYYNEYNGIHMRQSSYIFPGLPGQYAVLTGSSPQLGGEQYDAMFDAAARTMRVHGQPAR